MMELAWLIPLLPFLSFLLLLVFGRMLKENSAYVGIVLLLGSFILSLQVLFERLRGENYKVEDTWLTIGNMDITMGIEINQLNALMLVIVSFVSLLVHVYSKGYMHDDKRFSVFYAYLGLFTFSMLALVLSPNLLQLYIFWELVGVCSFLLVGFYFYKEEARAAAKKAFIVTRIGDVGLFIAMILLFWHVGSFEYDEIFASVASGDLTSNIITITAILIFVGAIGKSGQFPLHTWLPDAMEGPTPVSALIHAATMVAAGVYLVATMYPLFLASELALSTVAIVGGVTAIFAASIGLVQTDIKRVLAYSTVSQLGYMMLALGVGGYVAGVFHLMTHAFFKALLFLAAGSVIHAVHTQNIEKMGGLWKKLKWTAPLFLIGTLAISGIPLFSGFFSKEEILAAAYLNGDYGLFALALTAAFFTAFYMFRLFFMVFMGEVREANKDAHESPLVMVVPMALLAFLAIFAGYVNTPWFGTFLGDWLLQGNESFAHGDHHPPVWIALVAVLVTLLGIYLAWAMYVKKTINRHFLARVFSPIYKLLLNKYYIDELYNVTIVKFTRAFGLFLNYFDRFVVGGIVTGVALFTDGIGRIGSRVHNGQTQMYGAVVIFALAVIVVLFAWTGGLLG
ncbi:NADH-quinone oxidoreductase subunit L [Lottiidibacillus patelloidae]|uniref:NADH-quinone oxidoreductase subunit L n=1 Tax=Lottiidibacillus patelloidae TaxID=2670334 RepID=A0A263BS83_9BACI|nr:NADH-quinone oxidoreductase subunit L [Lottiidibacillus patelloidae]OZM56549.1 NADH-quinone oxidoreductase subunit L [Lottiidibacillus patelloidae]